MDSVEHDAGEIKSRGKDCTGANFQCTLWDAASASISIGRFRMKPPHSPSKINRIRRLFPCFLPTRAPGDSGPRSNISRRGALSDYVCGLFMLLQKLAP